MNRREAIVSIIFEDDKEFGAYHKAEKWCKDNGYSFGSSCSNSPTAVFKGEDHYVAKWRNLSPEEKNAVDGLITYSSMRSGPVKLDVFR